MSTALTCSVTRESPENLWIRLEHDSNEFINPIQYRLSASFRGSVDDMLDLFLTEATNGIVGVEHNLPFFPRFSVSKGVLEDIITQMETAKAAEALKR